MSSTIDLAIKHVNNGLMASSAQVCLNRAVRWEQKDKPVSDYWAVKSLAYSVGIFHADYQAAQETAQVTG